MFYLNGLHLDGSKDFRREIGSRPLILIGLPISKQMANSVHSFRLGLEEEGKEPFVAVSDFASYWYPIERLRRDLFLGPDEVDVAIGNEYKKYKLNELRLILMGNESAPRQTIRQIAWKLANTCDYLEDILILNQVHDDLGYACHTAMCSEVKLKHISMFRLSNSNKKKLGIMIEDFLLTGLIVQEVFKSSHVTDVIILNGRFPGQVGARKMSEKLGLKTLFFELGASNLVASPNKFFLNDYPPQDRLRLQLEISKLNLPNSQKVLIRQEMESWARNMSTNQRVNEFISGFRNNNLQKSQQATKKDSVANIVYFTSTIEETVSSRGYYQTYWKNQLEGMNELIAWAKESGAKITIRIHPRALDRSWEELILLIAVARRNGVAVVFPHAERSSYELMDESILVATWKSTIGIEARLRGKQVILLSPTNYDSVGGVIAFNRTFKNETKFTTLSHSQSIPLSDRELMVLYFIRNYGHPVQEVSHPDPTNLLTMQESSKEPNWKAGKTLAKLRYFLTPRLALNKLEKLLSRKWALKVFDGILITFSYFISKKKLLRLGVVV